MLRRPRTRSGRQALLAFGIAFGLVCLGLVTAGIWFAAFEDTPGEQESPPLWLAVPLGAASLAAACSAVAGGILAVLALSRGDRSGLLLFPLLATAVVLFFVIGEAVVPH